MNKLKRLIINYFSISIILFIASYGLHLYNEYDQNRPVNNEKIKSEIQKIENILESLCLNTEIEIKKIKFEGDSNVRNILFKELNFEINENFSVYIFNKDYVPVYWTDNNLPLPEALNDSVFKKRQAIHLENGWYLSRRNDLNGFKICAFYKLKSEYFYENKFLGSNYTLDIPKDYLLSEKPIEIGFNIQSENGDYLFTLIPPGEQNTSGTGPYAFPGILFILGIIFLMLFVNKLIRKYSEHKFSYLTASLLTLAGTFIILIIVKHKIPFYIHELSFFELKEISNISIPVSTIDLFLFSILLIFICNNFFRIIPFESIFNKLKINSIIHIVIFSLTITFIFFYFVFIGNITKIILNEFTITVNIQKDFSENINGILSHLIIGILFTSFIFLSDHFIKLAQRITDARKMYISAGAAFLILSAGSFLILIPFYFLLVIGYIVIILFIIIIRFYKQDYTYYAIISLIFVTTLFLVIFEQQNKTVKDEQFEHSLIRSLANERDQMAERFLTEINERLSADTSIVHIMKNITADQDLLLYDYLKRKYFYGFWEKYDMEIVICGNSELYRRENQAANCDGYYSILFNEAGEKILHTNFYFIRNNSGKITYTGAIKIPQKIDERKLALYINLSEKLVSKSLGYPKLLIDNVSDTEEEITEYSYAKYTNGTLAVKSGKFQYDLADTNFKPEKNKTYIESEGYRHLIYENKKGQKIVLSKEVTRLFDQVITFAYLFVFYNLIILITILIVNRKFILKKLNPDFKNQIRFSMIFILIVSFFLFGAGTIYYAVKENKRVNNKEMTDKVQSVLIELTHKLDQEDSLSPNWHTDKYDHLDELLIKFSQVFFSDINLYDLNGRLLATSRSEIFNRGLTGKQMNSTAYKMMAVQKKAEFIQKESIGTLEYSSIYIPLKNDRNKLIAYINLPYFSKNDSLQKNLSNVLIATVNLYVVLFLLTVFLAFFISTEITRPLRMLQSKFKALQFGKKHQEIIYNKNDEIGELVQEYNTMVNKLEISAKKLAESERESAWREMAKQIAHEIKNPLTPMKLSIQLLQKTWYDESENKEEFERRLNNVSETLIEQINTLSSIASEFSSFAKMPKARNEEVLIAKKLKTVTGLFENTENIKLELILNENDEMRIIADKEQVSRVFINLIKNSVQAIPPEKEGKITIELTDKKNKALITIEDNGNGIPEDRKERLFEPSFTTKTTGMGIGLAIVKNIVNSAGGDIYFKSESGKGTKFFVEFLKV